MADLIDYKLSTGSFDVIFVHLIRMAEYVKDFSTFKILDMTDAQSLNYTRSMAYRKGIWSLINRTERTRVKHYEQTIWKHFDKTLVVSPVDSQYFKNLDEKMDISLLQNGVDIHRYKYRLGNHSHKQICFIGNMRTFPNADAVVWFSNSILPIIKAKHPNMKFFIVGTEPSRKVKNLSRIRNVTVTGQVADIAAFVYDSSVSVAPMRVGAGVQNKILESMALGTPVVTTQIGLEGIDCTPGKDVLVANSPSAFADAVSQLIQNRHLRTKISKNARKFIESKYVWDRVLKKLDAIIEVEPRRLPAATKP
jgi:sugar transferase (PEP-CTERM/EpsH1 system associated)